MPESFTVASSFQFPARRGKIPCRGTKIKLSRLSGTCTLMNERGRHREGLQFARESLADRCYFSTPGQRVCTLDSTARYIQLRHVQRKGPSMKPHDYSLSTPPAKAPKGKKKSLAEKTTCARTRACGIGGRPQLHLRRKPKGGQDRDRRARREILRLVAI